MPYARINMVEFKSIEEKDRRVRMLKKNIKTVFPDIRAFASIKTSATSQLTISIYDDQDAADQAAAQFDSYRDEDALADLFSHEGSVKHFFIEANQVDALLQSGS